MREPADSVYTLGPRPTTLGAPTIMALSGISVVLCCARQDEPHLSVVVEHLRRESIEPVVLGGVEDDAHRLGHAVDAEHGRALFVLCKSTELGPSAILRLEGLFGARKGPSHRLIVTRLAPDDALSMVKDIRAAMSGFSSSRSSFEDSDDDAGSLREVVNISGISAVGSDARSVTPVRERLASRQTPADPLAIPMRGKAAEHAARVPAHQSGGWRNADVGDTLSEKRAPLAGGESGSASAAAPRSLLPEPTPPRSGVLLPALVGGLLVAVLGVGALLVTRDQGPRPAPVGTARGPAPAPTGATTPDPPQPAPTPAPAPTPTPDPNPAAADGETGAAADAAGTGGEGADGSGGEVAPEPGTSGGGDVDAAIAEAIANSEMRALDLLLVLNPDGERPWRKAVDHCRRVRVNGVGEFRLPTLPELKKLRAARMLKEGRYWSGTRAASDANEVYVLDRNTRKVELMDKEAEGVIVLCVRTR